MRVMLCRYERSLIQALADRGHDIALILTDWDRENQNIDDQLLGFVDTIYQAQNLDSLYELARIAAQELLREAPAQLVINTSEFSQLSSAYMASLLGLESPSIRQSFVTRDKRAMKAAVRKHGVRTAAFTSIQLRSPDQMLDDVCENFNFPVIVKPPTGSGSAGVEEIADASALRRTAEDRRRAGEDFLMVEELILGSELHVNGVWEDGSPTLFAVSRYIEPRLRQTPGGRSGSIFVNPADDPELYERARELHLAVNEGLDIVNGVSHMEVFQLESGELIFSEIATRVPGGAIPEALATAGLDIRELWLDSELGATGVDNPLAVSDVSSDCVGWINIAPEGPGVITREPSDAVLSSLPGVVCFERVLRRGARIGPLKPSLWCLMVVIRGVSEEEFLLNAQFVAEKALEGYVVSTDA